MNRLQAQARRVAGLAIPRLRSKPARKKRAATAVGIVVVLGAIAALLTVAWFVANRKQPEDGASHAESSPSDSASPDGHA